MSLRRTQRVARSYRLPSNAGSPQGEPLYLAVGKLRRPHGIRGEMVLEVLTDFPERFRAGAVVYVGPRRVPLTIRSVRPHRDLLLVAFEGYEDRNQVEALRNMLVAVPAEEAPPPDEGEVYLHQLLGLRVVTDEGVALGRLVEILETGANDVYIVEPEEGGAEILLPAIDEVVLRIDLERGEMTVHLLEGLLE